MRTRIATLFVALAVALLAPAAALGGEHASATYHGEWTLVDLTGCGGGAYDTGLKGHFNVTLLRDGRAVVNVVEWDAGQKWAAWGGKAFGEMWTQREDPPIGSLFALTLPLEGYELGFVVSTDDIAQFTIDFRDGCVWAAIGEVTH